jgi:hypothetical protein
MMKLNYVKPCRFTPVFHIQSRKFRRLILLAGMLVIPPILAISCTGNSADKTQPEPYFPVQKEVAWAELLTLLPGKLVMDDAGYLRVNVTNDLHALIIWPYGYSLRIEDKEMWILNDKGQAIMRVGDSVKLGGGFIPASAVEELIGHALPEYATGPYFLSNRQ